MRSLEQRPKRLNSNGVLIALARDEVVQFLTTGTFNLLSKTKFTLRLSGVIQSKVGRTHILETRSTHLNGL